MQVIAHFAASERIVRLHVEGHETAFAHIGIGIAVRTDGKSTDDTLCGSFADEGNEKKLLAVVASFLDEFSPDSNCHKDLV